MSETVGILAIQGAFAKHQQMIAQLGYATRLVRNQSDLDAVDRLIMPGGESTTMVLLLHKHGLWDVLQQFCREKPVLGTCAGSILLAKKIMNDAMQTLATIDIVIDRNSYGRQIDSFSMEVDIQFPDHISPFHAIFIRAPQIVNVGDSVNVLASLQDKPILVQYGKALACTFHPELTDDPSIHQYFMEIK